ncbi:MAG: hypothetical protein ACRC9U_03495 [Metamycoplasmataceae bacterium]
MNKKSLFSIGALSVAALAIPLVVVTSCSDEVEIKYIEVTPKLKVSSNISFFEVQANPITKETLDKAFNGITNENLDQFTALWDSTNKKIVLVSKDGYKFGSINSSSNKLDSIKIIPTTIKLNITVKETPEEVFQAEVDANPIARATLNKVFDGITDENFNQFKSVWDQKTRKIILTSKEGYTFNSGNDSLDSPLISTGLSYLDIVAKKEINEGIKEKDLIENRIPREVLEKAFDGITNANYNNFVSIWNSTSKTINLIPNEGYRFGSASAPQATESSIPLPKLILNINLNINIDKNGITREEMVASPITRATLDKAFIGITNANANAFEASYLTVPDNTPPIYAFVLTAKTGYEFDRINNSTGDQFVSMTFNLKEGGETITYIDIKAKGTITEGITNEEVTAPTITKTTLDKVFDGITEQNFNQFTSAWDEGTNKITLTANSGYKFGTEATNAQDTVVSVEIKIAISLNIVQKDIDSAGITKAEIEASPLALTTLEKAFTGITAENMANFKVQVNKDPANTTTPYSITLTANEGFGFGTSLEKTIVSKSFNVKEETTITYLNVVEKADIIIRITDAEVAANPITQVTLNKVFNNITDENFNQFTSAWDAGSNKITLTAKDGYKFGSATNPKDTVISMAIKTVQALNITIIPNLENAGITKDEIEAGTLTKATLDKAFNGITDTNMANFTANVYLVPNNTNLYYFVLTAEEGYGFGNKFGNQIPSTTFIAKENAITYITVKQSTTPKPITDKELVVTPLTQATLEKAFDGITNENFKQFKSAWDAKTNIITLTANSGYKFGNATTNTDAVVSIKITPVKGLEITANDKVTDGITIFNLNAYKMTKVTLEKAFTGITDEDIKNEKFVATVKTTGTGTDKSYNIVLTTKKDFVFSDGSTEITSQSFKVGIGYINVIQRTDIINPITDQELKVNPLGQLTLEKAFFGINYENFPGLEATITDNIITLKAKEGYKLGTEAAPEETVVSIKITPVKVIDVILNPDVYKNGITMDDIKDPKTISLATLQKAFIGVTAENMNNFDVEVLNPGNGDLYIIVLTAKSGYGFGNLLGNQLVSAAFEPKK